MVLASCGLIMFAGTLSWREGKLVDLIDAGKASPEFKIPLPYSSKPEYHNTRRWLAGRSAKVEEIDAAIRKSIRNRPLSATAWLDFAEVKIRQGKPEQAGKYIAVAREMWPHRRVVSWKAAMLWIQLGENDKALAALKSYLESKPEHVQRVAVLASRLQADPDRLLDSLIPNVIPDKKKPNFYMRSILYYAMNQGNLALADAAWQRINLEFLEDKTFNSYMNFLVSEKQRDRALSIWQQVSGYSSLEQITNGGFENKPEWSGFDWKTSKVKGAKIIRDDGIAFEGKYSLRIDFNGTENIDFKDTWQLIPVEPGETYRVQGFWRGAYITTRSNPYFQFYSVGAEKNNLSASEPKRLTWDWEKFEVELTVPTDAWFAIFRLRRDESTSLDNEIAGSIWMDQIEIEKISDQERLSS